MKISQVINHLRKFIANGDIQELKYEFENLNQIASSYYGGEIYTCEWKEELNHWHVEYAKNNDYNTVQETFVSYLESHINILLNSVEDELTIHYLNRSKDDFKHLLEKVKTELNNLMNTRVENEHIAHLFKQIDFFRASLVEKYTNEESAPKKILVSSGHKIKWIGTLNTLSTFLLDYSSDKNNLNKPLMERDITAFKHLMLNCFVDHQGNNLSKETVDTYFDTNKQVEKRAKKYVIQLEKEELEVTIERALSPSKKKSR